MSCLPKKQPLQSKNKVVFLKTKNQKPCESAVFDFFYNARKCTHEKEAAAAK
jgi:hypothetical protein